MKTSCSNLHSKTDSVEQDEKEHEILEQSRVDHLPRFVLPFVGRYVPSHWFRFQCILNALPLYIN